jgi:hypothetical protein
MFHSPSAQGYPTRTVRFIIPQDHADETVSE